MTCVMFNSLQEAVKPGPLDKGFVKRLHDMSNAHKSEEMVATTMCRRYLAKLLKRDGFITVQ